MKDNRLNPADDAKVEVYSPDGSIEGTHTARGYHSVAEAIAATFAFIGAPGNPEDYVYRVTNEATGTWQRYRVSAGGRVTVIE